ncbi:alpha/beta hydrolase family protein [Enterovirga rhinocerotis]|uniref:Carboxymethylenebutenolidase n=1 Tax=Enterovirga rhinocerotis TaxID=1339210 RepID=A0A4V3DYR5_9HYPH|nr:dienelactone hydrolase family protein [Enterovirga rhinocerotis]TDR93619.1 carboxymethylenebutenolidase [Enterovirga rhinocerotis]
MTRRTVMLGGLAAACGLNAGLSGARADETGFRSGGRPIRVEWFAPQDVPEGESAPAVLLLHGAEGLMLATAYRAAARVIARAGIGVAFVHYFDRTGDKICDLDRMRETIPPWAETVRDALTWLAGRPGIDPDRLGIVGISLGAGLALHVAAQGERRIKAIVDFYGPISAGLLPPRPKLPPVLILHGEADPVVPIIHARTLEAHLKAAGTPYEIKIYPGQVHGFRGAAQMDASRRSTAFLVRHLRARRAERR